jgi:DNA-binding response OmpR family regulator/pimeloyl-ACP methyl ester carboxylesterase
MEGFPDNMSSFYEQVHVCPTCYDAYRCLDWARGLLRKADKNAKHPSPYRPTSSSLSDNTSSSHSLQNKLSASMPSLPSQSGDNMMQSEISTSTEGRIGQRKNRKDKQKSWKNQLDQVKTESVPAQNKKKSDFAAIESYVRGKNYISRENSTSPKKNRAGSSSSPKRQGGNNQVESMDNNQVGSPSTKTNKVKSNVYKGKVLIASSDLNYAESAKQMLEEAFFDILLVIDGREALNEVTLNWKKYDTVIVDRDSLPLLDAFEVCKGIRAHEKTIRKSYSHQNRNKVGVSEKFLNFRMPVICFTKATTQADLTSYMKADMDGCISKPLDQASLITTIRAAIPQHLAPLTNPSLDETNNSKNATAKVQKFGLLGEFENSVDSASMALKTMPIASGGEGSEFQGMVQLDADTKVPFLVMNGSKYSRLRQASTNERYFNLVICHDIFDTYERMKILLQPIVQRYQAIQVLVWNYPGQSQTEWRSTQALNNEYLAACLNEVLGQVGHKGTKDFNTEEPFYLLGFGYGANVASYYMAHYRAPNIRGLLLANGWAFVDSYLAGIMHDCINIFKSSPSSRPDLPVYFFSRFLFSKDYLAKVSVPLALNIYTAVYNSITIPGRIALCNGLLKSVDIRPLLRSIDCPIVCFHSDQNNFIRPIHVEPFVSNRGGEVRSIHHALQDFRRTCVVWIHGGHEMFQENRKQTVLLLEQILTGYHEVHEITFPSASSVVEATNAVNSRDLRTSIGEMSMEDKFTQSVLSLSKTVASSTPSIFPTASTSPGRATANTASSTSHGRKATSPSHTLQSTAASTAGTRKRDTVSPNRSQGSPGRLRSVSFENSVESWQEYSDSLVEKQRSILTFDSQKSKTLKDKTSQITNINNVPMNDVHNYPEVKEYMQWRLKRNKKRLQRLQMAAQSIQCAFRAYLARKLVRNIRQIKAAQIIQRVFRGYLGRKKFFNHVRQLWAAIYIQKVYRGYISRKFYFMMQVRIAAAANIQRVYRGYRARERVKRIRAERNKAACVIQAMFRRYQARRDAWLRRQFKNCATIIQRNFRGFLGRKRAAAERDKYIFSKSQSQGIEFGRQMLLEHKLHVTRLQSDVTLLSQEKVSAEEQIEALLEEIASFEEGVRVLEKEMHQLSKVEAEAAAFMDEDSKFELREQKMRLDREFGEMLGKIANRKDMLNDIEKKLAAIDKARQGKEEELRTLERKLVVLLEDQQKELNMIKRKQDVRGALLAASHAELSKVTGSAGSTAAGSTDGTSAITTAGGKEFLSTLTISINQYFIVSINIYRRRIQRRSKSARKKASSSTYAKYRNLDEVWVYVDVNDIFQLVEYDQSPSYSLCSGYCDGSTGGCPCTKGGGI